MVMQDGFQAILITLISSITAIALGIVYFGITLWIIKIASQLFFGVEPNVNWAVLSASLMAIGAILSGSIDRKQYKKISNP